MTVVEIVGVVILFLTLIIGVSAKLYLRGRLDDIDGVNSTFILSEDEEGHFIREDSRDIP